MLETITVIPTTSFSIIPALCLLGIGILVGHLLFYRYEQNDTSDLELDENPARDQSRKQMAHLMAKVEQQNAEITSLRQARQNLETQWHELKSRENKSNASSLRAQHELTEAMEKRDRALETEKKHAEHLQAANDRITELEDALETAIQELKTSASTNEQLTSHSTELKSQVSQLQDLREQLSKFEAENDQLKSQLADFNGQLKENESKSIESLNERETMLAQLTVERDRRNAAESKLLSVEADLAEVRFEAEQLATLQEENESASITIANQNARITKIGEKLDQAAESDRNNAQVIERLKLQLTDQEQLTAQIEQLSSALLAMKAENNVLRSAASSQSAEIEQTDTHLTKVQKEHRQAKDQLNDIQAKSNALQDENEQLVGEFAKAKMEIAELAEITIEQNTQIASLEFVRQQLQEQQTIATDSARELRKRDFELADLRNERDKCQEEIQNLKRRFKQEKSKVNEQISYLVEQRHGSAEQTQGLELALQQLEHQRLEDSERIQELQDRLANNKSSDVEFERLQDKLQSETESRMMIEVSMEDRDNEIAHLRSHLAEFERLNNQAEQLRKNQKTQRQAIEVARKERDEALAAERMTKEIVSELREELQGRLQAIEALEQDREETVARLAAEKRARGALNEQLISAQADFDRQQRSWKRKLNDREKKVEQFRGEVEELRNQKDGQAVQHFISLASFRTGNSGVDGFPEMEKMTFDDSLGPLYRRAPKDRDDLKMIHGIASIMERKLNKLGVYSFQQIMEWDDVAVAEFSKLLSFGDRVQRDNWIGQARRLFREKMDQKAA